MKILKKHIKTNQNITTTRYVFGPVCVLKKISSKTFNKTFLFGIRIGYKNKINVMIKSRDGEEYGFYITELHAPLIKEGI
jgi:hypothetical protein